MEPFIVVIPARYAASRLPGKPLVDIGGRPMIAHVIDRARESRAERVIVATDDRRITTACRNLGAEVMETDTRHESGTDRLAEVSRRCGLDDDTIVVNLQGDEPLMPPELLDAAAGTLAADAGADLATLSTPLQPAEAERPDVVKVVCDRFGRAMYFSRARIPYCREGEPPADLYRRHLGIYAYRAGFLRAFTELAPSPLEVTEKLEQLRALWHGYRIRVGTAGHVPTHGVDTPEDVPRVAAALGQSGHGDSAGGDSE